MQYIEIQDGITLSANAIQGVEKLEGNKCKVYTHHTNFLAHMPYETLVALLKEELIGGSKTTDDDFIKSTMQKLDSVLTKSQHFAG